MSSREFILICLSFAFANLIVSEVAVARELAKTSSKSLNNEVDSAEGVEESTSPGVGHMYPADYSNCPYKCCGPTLSYAGCRCCSYAGEAVDAEPQTQP